MKKMLISLVSEQVIPNILFIKEFRTDIDKFLFISTNFMEKKKKVFSIKQSLQLKNEQCKTIVVDGDSIDDIIEKMGKEDFENVEIIINATGGTKIMFHSIYSYFSKLKSCKIYYLPLGKSNFQELYPNNKNVIEVEQELNLQEYFVAHNCFIRPKQEDIDFDIDIIKKLKNFMLSDNNPKFIAKFFNEVGIIIGEKTILEIYNQAGIKKNIPDFTVVSKFCKQIGVEKITEQFRNLIIYQWLEYYTYLMVKKELLLEDDQIMMGLEFSSNENSSEKNELDVAFIYKNKLHIIECKTGLKGNDNKSKIPEIVYKLQAIRSNFGINASGIIVTTESILARDGSVKTQAKRSKVFNLKWIDRRYFEDENKFKTEFLGKL